MNEVEYTLNRIFEKINILNGDIMNEKQTENFLELLSINNKITELKLLHFPSSGLKKLSHILINENMNINSLELRGLRKIKKKIKSKDFPNFQDEEVEYLNEILKKNKRIEKLKLISTLRIQDIENFFQILSNNTTIKTLSLKRKKNNTKTF